MNPRTPTGLDPQSSFWKIESFNKSFDYIINYDLYKEEFIPWLYEQTPTVAEDYLRRLDRLISGKEINNPDELYNIFRDESKNSKVAIRNFMRFLIQTGKRKASELIDFQAVIKIPKSGIREASKAFTTDEKIIEALEKVKDEKKILMIKLLAYSGIRLSEAVNLLRNFDSVKLEVNGKVARYEIHKVGGTKNTFFAYMPKNFAKELRKITGITESTFKGNKLAYGIILPNMLRKWNANFLDEQSIDEKYIDFFQGRTPEKILRKHYLELMSKADQEYAKIVDKFPF